MDIDEIINELEKKPKIKLIVMRHLHDFVMKVTPISIFLGILVLLLGFIYIPNPISYTSFKLILVGLIVCLLIYPYLYLKDKSKRKREMKSILI